MYHAFGERSGADDPHNLFVRTPDFRRQLESLLERGWSPLTLDAYLSGLTGGSLPRRSFLLTIDDGHASTVEAVPILAELQVPSVLFIPPGVLGGTSAWMPLMPDSPMLSEAELLDVLKAAPIEVGAHGWDHADLVGLTREQLEPHVEGAAQALEQLTGTRPRSFAYPRGLHDQAALDAVAEAGYAAAFSIHADLVPLALPRIDVNSTDTMRTFRMKTSAAWPLVAAAAARTPRLRALAHRVVGSARG